MERKLICGKDLLFFDSSSSKNKKNEVLPFVNILIDNTYKGTTSNDDGYYELNISETKTYTIVYSYLVYKTVKKKVSIRDARQKIYEISKIE